MTLNVDRDACDLYGNCVKEAPQALRLDDADEELVVLVETPTDDMLSVVRRAIGMCPKAALSLVE